MPDLTGEIALTSTEGKKQGNPEIGWPIALPLALDNSA
jgi:hypothetical protein